MNFPSIGLYYDPVGDEFFIVRRNFTSIEPYEIEFNDGFSYGMLFLNGFEVYLGKFKEDPVENT